MAIPQSAAAKADVSLMPSPIIAGLVEDHAYFKSFMYFSGSFLNFGMQSSQQNPMTWP